MVREMVRQEFPEMFWLVASSLGHLRGQDSTVCGSSLQRGHMRVCGGVEDQFGITVRFSFFNYTLFPSHTREMRLIDVIKQEMMALVDVWVDVDKICKFPYSRRSL